MYSFKLTATGINKLINNKATDMTFLADCAKEDLDDVLGKVIFVVESAGFAVDTHTVYTDALETIKNAKLNDKFKKVYSVVNDDVALTISVKEN